MARPPLTKEQSDAARSLRKIWDNKHDHLGLTQEKVADSCGWTQGAVGHYLNGRTALNIDAVIKFANVLEVKGRDIYPELVSKYVLALIDENEPPAATVDSWQSGRTRPKGLFSYVSDGRAERYHYRYRSETMRLACELFEKMPDSAIEKTLPLLTDLVRLYGNDRENGD